MLSPPPRHARNDWPVPYMSCYASNVHGPRSCASHPGPVPGLPLPRPSPFPHSQPQPKRNFLSTCMYIRTLIGRSGTPVLAIMMLVLCLSYAHGSHANGYSDNLKVLIESNDRSLPRAVEHASTHSELGRQPHHSPTGLHRIPRAHRRHWRVLSAVSASLYYFMLRM